VRLRAVAELRSDDNPLSFEKLVATYLVEDAADADDKPRVRGVLGLRIALACPWCPES
jgi:hypothetical protein